MKQAFAVISGAGVAGLAAALELSRAGWRVLVLERASNLRDGGHMMGLSGPGMAAVRRMGLLPELREVAYPDRGEHIYRDRHGRKILRLNYRELLKGIDWLTLRRTELVRVLHEALDEHTELRCGATITAVGNQREHVELTLSDSSTVRADLLIVADGVHSRLRQQLFVPDAACLRPLGYRYASYDVPDVLQLGQEFLSYVEPGLQNEYYGLDQHRLAALHVWRSAVDGEVLAADRLPLLERITARSHAQVRAILGAIDNVNQVVIDDLAMVELPQWHNGRVLLLGDAAHSLSLISGQGAGMALASAGVLAQELAKLGDATLSGEALEAVLQRHAQRLRPSVLKLQERSRRLAPAFVPSSALGFYLRNLAMRAAPDAMLKRYFLNGLKSEAEAAAALA